MGCSQQQEMRKLVSYYLIYSNAKRFNSKASCAKHFQKASNRGFSVGGTTNHLSSQKRLVIIARFLVIFIFQLDDSSFP